MTKRTYMRTRDAAATPRRAASASAIVRDVLRAPGRPLDPATRLGMESSFGHHFGRVRPERDGGEAVESGMSVGPPHDSFEREADSFAQRGDHSPLSPDNVLGLERGQVNATAPYAPDFSRIRIHADGRAGEAAQSLGAVAFTAGRDIVFGPGRYAPETVAGRRLLAHELTHVVQQATGGAGNIQRVPLPPRTNYRFDTGMITVDDLTDPEISMRLHSMSRGELRAYRERVMDPGVRDFIGTLLVPKPTTQIETNTLSLSQAGMDPLAGRSYWEQRTWKAFEIPNGFPLRFVGNPEERDAVYAALWQVFPQGAATAPTSKVVTIPPNADRPNALLYEFVIRPPVKAGGLPQLDMKFQREHVGSVLDTAVEPPKGYITPQLSFDYDIGFPDGADKYFATHQDERRQIAYWIKQQSGRFEQLVITQSVPKGGKGTPTETIFLVSGKKDKSGALTQIGIELRPGNRPAEVTPVEDYRKRDLGDMYLENAQTTLHPTKGDKLGYVNVAGVPPDELVSVKYVVAQYFTTTGTRDAEVDAVIPIAGANRLVFYTLRFRSDNEVDVERVGEKGSSAELDPSRMDIARVRGYDANAADPAKLKAWLGKRYPGITPTGTTVEELRNSANQEMTRSAGTPAWYQSNYKVPVLDGAATQKRLRNVHKLNTKQTPDADKKDFTPTELTLAELSLQTLTATILKLLRYVRLGRKTNSRAKDGTIRADVGGQTYWNGTEKSVLIYDGGITANASVFRGGPEGVNVPQAMLFTHEFGHSTEPTTGAKTAFDKFVKKAGIQPFTHYAESKPGTEFFAEAFAISQNDPEWLRNNHPSVAQWFETFNRTGRAPKP